MTVQRGRDLLIKMDMTGDGTFQTIAGLRATRISFNTETVDVTSLNSPGGWRELLAGAGVKAATISGSGVFRDAATDERARAIFFAGEIPQVQVIVPDFGTIQGPFQITSIEYAGSHNGEATYEMGLASAGQLDFVAMPEPGEEPEDYEGDGSGDPGDPGEDLGGGPVDEPDLGGE